MEFISRYKVVVGILTLAFLVGIIVFVTLNTSLFNENKKIANEVNRAEKGEVKRVDYNSSLPKNLEEYAQTDEGIDYEKLDKEEKSIADSWVDLSREEGDSALERDMKVEAKDGVYQSVKQYSKDIDKSPEELYEEQGNLYGDLGVGLFKADEGEATGLYYSNDFKKLGDFRIEGVYFNTDFNEVILSIRNEGNKIVYRNLLQKDIEVSINDISNESYRKTLEVEDSKKLANVIGVGLVKDVSLGFKDKFLDGLNVTNREDISSLPDKVKVSLKLEGDNVDYILNRNDKGNYTKFNNQLELELRN